MRYYDVLELVNEGKVEKLHKRLVGGSKNKALKMFRDYYEGNQWLKNGLMTDSTRSGRKIWKINSPDPKDLGVDEGDLAIWNVCDSTINVYSSYGRGSIQDKNRVVVEDNEELASKINDKINLNILISRSMTRAGVDSVAVWKYMEDGGIEFVDGLEVFPIYDGEDKVGTIRTYEISTKDPLVAQAGLELNKKGDKAVYTEIWLPETDGGVMWLKKYVNDVEIESGKAPFDFDPYIIIANKDSEFSKFDESTTEISDIERIIPIQDSINKVASEEGIIISKVAFPIVKVIKEVYDAILKGEVNGDAIKEQLSELSLVAGKIIVAPIETESGADIPTGVDSFIENLFAQLYRITGIPKSVYVTEGVGNISEKTMNALMESLKRRVDEKRENITKGIKTYVAYYTGNAEIVDAVDIQWAEMFEMSKEEKSEVLNKTKGTLPNEYIVESFLDILGDGERLEEVKAMMVGDDINFRVQVETQKMTNKLETKSAKQLESERKQRQKLENKLRTTEVDKNLLESELKTINSKL